MEEGNIGGGCGSANDMRPAGRSGSGRSLCGFVLLDYEGEVGEKFGESPLAELGTAADTFFLLILVI